MRKSLPKMTDENGITTWTGAYQPFGEMITGSGNVHGFTGKELDAEMGLNYFCQRLYDSQIGRFMTLDPFGGYIELPQTQMRYGYCMNNPLKYIDPLGLDGDDDYWRLPEDYLPPCVVWAERWYPDLPSLQRLSEILGYGNIGDFGRPLGFVPPSREEIVMLNLGNQGFEKFRVGTENGIEIIKEPPDVKMQSPSGSPRHLSALQESHRQGHRWVTWIGATAGLVTVLAPGFAPMTGLIAGACAITSFVGSLMAPKGTFTEADILFDGITGTAGVLLPLRYSAVVGVYTAMMETIGHPATQPPQLYPWVADHTAVYIKKR